MSNKKGKLSFEVLFYLVFTIRWLFFVTNYLWLSIWIFSSQICYYLQKLVPFARCCTSRNFCIPLCLSYIQHVIKFRKSHYQRDKRSQPRSSKTDTLRPMKRFFFAEQKNNFNYFSNIVYIIVHIHRAKWINKKIMGKNVIKIFSFVSRGR